MPEIASFLFTHKEVAAALVKEQDIHEGLWGVSIEFGFGAANVPGPDGDTMLPAVIIPVLKIGIQRFDEANNLTVDAAEINPAPKARSARSRRKIESE